MDVGAGSFSSLQIQAGPLLVPFPLAFMATDASLCCCDSRKALCLDSFHYPAEPVPELLTVAAA